MFRAAFEHEDAAVFFHYVSRDLFKTFRTNRSRRFYDTVKSKIRPRELAIRRCDVYELTGIIQFIAQMTKGKNIVQKSMRGVVVIT